MSVLAQRVVRAVAVPRLDPDGLGVHLAWSGPELTPLASAGYEVRRRLHRDDETQRVCAVFDAVRLSLLGQVGMVPDELGTMLVRGMVQPASEPGSAVSGADAELDPASAGGGAALALEGHEVPEPRPKDDEGGPAREPPGPTDLGRPAPSGGSSSAGRLSSSLTMLGPGGAGQSAGPLSVYTQELLEPAELVFVSCAASAAFAIPLSSGKAVGAAAVPAGGVTFVAQYIDTVVIYGLDVTALEICAESPVGREDFDAGWADSPVLASGLTLPLRETDPTLLTDDDELRAARQRLLAAESLTGSEATHLADALRSAAGSPDLGRPCDRVILDRTDLESPFQESLFSSRIALLALDPRLRRVLGFGFADRTAVHGETYDYLVSGAFDTADLDDDVYDVHNVPSGTALPSTFRIRELSLRCGAPVNVVLDPEPHPDALTAVSRRGLRITQGDPIDGFVPWWSPGLSCVIDLPRAVDSVVFEVPDTHNLSCVGAMSVDPIGAPAAAIPAGPSALVSFPAGIDQLRLSGNGTLFAIRLPQVDTGETVLSRALGPTTFAAVALPESPLSVTADNLQTPSAVLTGDIGEQTQLPARPQPGFRVWWAPSTGFLSGAWPPDLTADPPTDALAFVIEHRRVYEDGGTDPWEAIQAGDNLTFGSWPAKTGSPSLGFGVDLDDCFPIHRPRKAGAEGQMAVTDVLSEVASTHEPPRAAAPLGSYHQYRIRAMDVVGRVSATWVESNRPRLEKRLPPPPPAGPQPPPTLVGNPPRLSAPPGVRARTILASDPDLSDADDELLAGHRSAVLLDWGWRAAERELDMTTSEFRVYALRRIPTEVPGTILTVASTAGQWLLAFETDRWLTANECAGQWVTTGDETFRIVSHTGGSTPQIVVAASALNPSHPPLTGPTVFGRPLAPDHQRPSSWDARVAVVPLTAADTYRYVIFDLLNLDAVSRTDSAWVGVAAADAEPYVDDELPLSVPNGGRPGNESSIAAVTATARHRGRPTFSMPPPLADVPVLVTDEPTGRQVTVALDASALLGGAVATSAVVALDRCPADAILATASVNAAEDVVLRRADETEQAVAFPNVDDETAVRAALSSDHPERMATRYLLYLLGHFDRPDELFDRTGGELQSASALSDVLAPKPGRYFYRVRLADSSGAVSVGGAILPVVVRVPSTAPMPVPLRFAASISAGSLSVKVGLDSDPDLAWALLFYRVASWDTPPPDPARAQLIRVPNRRDLYPEAGVRLRLADGSMLTPTVKAVDDADVASDGQGRLTIPIRAVLPADVVGQPRQVQYWCYGLSRDGLPSRPLGPYTLAAGAAP